MLWLPGVGVCGAAGHSDRSRALTPGTHRVSHPPTLPLGQRVEDVLHPAPTKSPMSTGRLAGNLAVRAASTPWIMLTSVRSVRGESQGVYVVLLYQPGNNLVEYQTQFMDCGSGR